MIITTAEQLRNITGSYYANNDFSKIASMVEAVEQELTATLGLTTLDTLEGNALRAAQQAVGYMATMRFYRLNDISHENAGRKVKIDKENEARPFEWQLARDDRMHLEEYYRALNRLINALQDNAQYQQSAIYKRQQRLVVKSARALTWLTGVDESPWLYITMIPHLADSQRYVEKAYGNALDVDAASELADTDTLDYAVQKAVALGALVLMGRTTSLQTLPYGLMRLVESDGGGNQREQSAIDQLDRHLKHLSKEQYYWIEEMKQLRDEAAGTEQPQHLQMPDNDPHNKFFRV